MIKMKDKETLHPRVQREKEELFSAKPEVDIDRIKILLEVYGETEGQAPVIQRAKLFAKLCAEKAIYIDGNPIVGALTKYKYGSYPIPELGVRWMKKVDKFSLQRGQVPLSAEQKEWIEKAVNFWEDRNVFKQTREIILQSRGVDIVSLLRHGVATELVAGGFINPFPDFSKVLRKGLMGIAAEIEEEKGKLDIGLSEDLNRWYFYQGALLCLHGMVNLAQRYATLAREMARGERDPVRKAELEATAGRCDHVPANPARNFLEALQVVWFVILGTWIQSPVVLFCPPCRFTQYMYPFYKKEKEEGRLTDEEAIELIQLFFLKLNSLAQVLPPHGFAFSQSRLGLQLSLGGLTEDGEDATNDLDFLVLEAQRRIRLPEPLVNVLYHDKLSEMFLLKCVDLIQTGIGQPAFHDVTKIVARHLYHDRMTVEEARSATIVGCVQSAVPGCSAQPWEGVFNTSKMMELALNNGKDSLTGVSLGLETGDAESFQSYEELYGAVMKQLKCFVPLVRQTARTAWNIQRNFPSPFSSALIDDCIKNGKDIIDGGARYYAADGTSIVGVVDLANSLAAVRKLVFEDKKITMRQLREALAADFEGFEEVQRMCLDAPKYGNDEDYVDSIAKEIFRTCWDEHQRFLNYLGRPVKPEAYSVVAHFAIGRFTGALPSGRKARTPLTDASVSAMPGTDKYGPTALAKSAAKVIDTVKYGCNHLNMKFHPVALEGREGARKFISMIKTYMDLGGYHVQFNCVSSETLKEAQAHPEKYRDLVVRVAGFSAYFVHLDPMVQNEIMKRTELRFR